MAATATTPPTPSTPPPAESGPRPTAASAEASAAITEQLAAGDVPMFGAALLGATANVIMQLGLPGVGYGVVESRVESGRVFDHPIKRTRTTLAYLAVAMQGTAEEKRRYRQAVNGAHRHVHHTDDSPVEYNAFDPNLQLWVAACLYKGVEDTYEAFIGPLDDQLRAAFYAESSALATTLQVPHEMWPADHHAFQRYWDEGLRRIAIDDTVRDYLHDLTELRFIHPALGRPFAPFNRFVTTGFLPPEFRLAMRLHWNARKQRRFDRMTRTLGALIQRLPRALREFPFNYVLWDLRWRMRTGRPLV